jgi:hypothetical protein
MRHKFRSTSNETFPTILVEGSVIWSRDRPSSAQYDKAAPGKDVESCEKLLNLGHEAIEFSDLAADRPLPERRADNDDLTRSVTVDLIHDTDQRSIAKYQQSGLRKKPP